MKLIVALPCLNEEKTVRQVVERIPRHIDGFDEVSVLVIDDGSTDNTVTEARAAGAHVISHGNNRGVGAAFQTALAHATAARFDIMVNIDADGQFAPEDIPKLTAPIVRGEAAFVTASRFIDTSMVPNMPFVKLWGNRRMSALVSRLTGKKFFDVSCGFRAYSREAMLHLNLHGRFTYTQETFLDLSSKGLPIKEVPIEVRYFADRTSRVANNLFRYALKTSTILLRAYRDYNPLRFFWGLGAAFFVLGAAVSSIMLAQYVQTGAFRGQLWSGFTGAFLVGVSFVLFTLGIVADMLDRQRQNQERILYLLKRMSDVNTDARSAAAPLVDDTLAVAQAPRRNDAGPVAVKSGT